MIKPPEQLIVEIIQSEMDLSTQNIWVRSQNRIIPEDKNLYVTVGSVSTQVVGNDTEMYEVDGTPWERNSVQTIETIQIDVFSASTEALFRRWEIVAALSSFYSKQTQEANFFKIYRIPRTFLNTSDAEGGSNLNRFTIQILCAAWYTKEREMLSGVPDGKRSYFDKYSTTVNDDVSIDTNPPLFEFDLPNQGPFGGKILQESGGGILTEDGLYLCQENVYSDSGVILLENGFKLLTESGQALEVELAGFLLLENGNFLTTENNLRLRQDL